MNLTTGQAGNFFRFYTEKNETYIVNTFSVYLYPELREQSRTFPT